MILKTLKKFLGKAVKKLFIRYVWAVDAVNGVDTLKKDTTTFIPEVQQYVLISGWLFDIKDENGVEDLFIEIEGKCHKALYGLIRTDVSFEYKEQRLRNSGFRCLIDREALKAGKDYTINLRLTLRGNRVKTIRTSIGFAIDGEKTRDLVSTSNEALEYSQYRGEVMSLQYIAGTGVEIGALHAPLSVDKKKAKVLYVDRMSQQDLYRQYPEFKKYDIVAPDIIDNGDELRTIADLSYDFCISNHVLEHLEDPLKGLRNWLRILKPGGILYLSVPLPYNVVDKHRQPTDISHIIDDHGLMTRDHQQYGQRRRDHFYDFVRSTNFSQSANTAFLEEKTEELLAMDYSIHFHVFSEETLRQMIDFIALDVALQVVEFVRNDPEEFIVIIKKLGY